jgi:hypothetical protein
MAMQVVGHQTAEWVLGSENFKITYYFEND